ncbi:hypothetical protein MMC20_005464 [Loxospora ochrophaea]|nr:hypothetical protein [Loxospora ochrophaea]
MSNPSGRVSIAAIQSQDGSYLFYSQPETGALAYLKSQWDKEAGAPLYQPIKIAIEKKVQHANAKSPQIAAVSYKSPNGPELRVYYISDDGTLQELCQSNGGPWFHGSLNDSEIKASPKSLLTASVDHNNKGQLKVYYNVDKDMHMRCAWVNVNESSWANKKINDDW